MRSAIQVILAGGVILAGAPAAFGQAEGDNPPTVEIIRWEVDRPNPPVSPTEFIPQPPGDPPVFQQGDSRSNIEGSGLKNDGAFLHHERDWVTVTFHLEDLDWETEQDPGQDEQEVDESVYLRVQIFPDPWIIGAPPNVPPVVEASDEFFGEPGADEGFKPLVIGDTYRDVEFTFPIPEFNGKSQARLRGTIEWDVRWFLLVEASNEQSPAEDEEGRVEGATADGVTFVAIESPGLGPPNSRPFADAGADRTVPVNTTVILDGSRTFDSFNVGFDIYDEDIFEKDFLTFTWEWVSGPTRVDPVPEDPNEPGNPRATVIFDEDETGAHVYRLLVDDNVNALPSTDSVTLTVVQSLPDRNPPVAVIAGPANAVPVGAIVTLYGDADPQGNTLSFDPDGDALTYRWQQTNELGGPLDPDELQDAFQPLSGLDEPRSSWQALTPGTFFFRLLVDDGSFRSSATFSVEVAETVTGGASDELAISGSSGDQGSSQPTLSGPAFCGTGLLPLAVVPLALCVMRRRIR